MNLYNECGFKYYLSKILKLNMYEDNIYNLLGSLYHHILELGVKGDIDVELEIDNYIKDKNLSKKELFYVHKLKDDISFTLNNIRNQMKLSKLDNIETEKEIVINKHDNLDIVFKGYIDKIMYKRQNDKTIIALVDYKTGVSNIDLKYLPYGLSMQLPTYLYLAKHAGFSNIKFAGFYLQKIMFPNFSIDSKKSLNELKNDYLKLDGYSTTNQDVLSMFDTTYKDSSIVRSLALTRDGKFYATSKVLSEKNIDKIIEITEGNINKVINDICEGKFDINPKIDGNINLSCEYCDFKGICYKSNEDNVFIKPSIKLDFLGGDDNE